MNKCNIKDGVGLIIPRENKDGSIFTDTVVLYDATQVSKGKPWILSDDFSFDAVKDHVVYVCGHGNKGRHTISGMSMKKLAKKLIEHGYTGKQKLILLSCHTKSFFKSKDMAIKLSKALVSHGIYAEIESFASGTTIVTNEKIADVNFTLSERHFFFAIQRLLSQKITLGSHTKQQGIATKQDKIIHEWNSSFVNGNGIRMIQNTVFWGLASEYCCILAIISFLFRKTLSMIDSIPSSISIEFGIIYSMLVCICFFVFRTFGLKNTFFNHTVVVSLLLLSGFLCNIAGVSVTLFFTIVLITTFLLMLKHTRAILCFVDELKCK